MSGIGLIIAVGVSVTSFVAFAINVLAPTDETSRTEARLRRLAERQRHQYDSEGGGDSFVSLLRSELNDQSGVLEKITAKLPALSDYLEQADVPMRPSKFIFLCVSCFAAGVVLCILSPAPLLLAPVVASPSLAYRLLGCLSNAKRDWINSVSSYPER